MMKKIEYLLFTLFIGLLLIPFVMAKDTVEIENIELDSKSDSAYINSEPNYSGLEMNFDVSFDSPGDFVRYKIYIKNTFDKDFEVVNETMFSDNKFFKYEFKSDDVIKANRSTVVYLTVSYNDEVDEDSYQNGAYEDFNVVAVKLLNNNKIVNPETSSSIFGFIVLIISVVLLVLLVMYGRKHGFVNNALIILLFGIACIPFIVKAIEELKIQANVKVSVKKVYNVIYHYDIYEFVSGQEYDSVRGDYLYCSDIYYGSVAEENHNYWCTKEGILIEKHHTGDTVTIKKIPYSDAKMENCSSPAFSYYHICENELETYESDFDFFEYYRYGDDEEQNKEELIFMNFTTSEGDSYDLPLDYWNNRSKLNLNYQDTFIMPYHDVELYLPEL